MNGEKPMETNLPFGEMKSNMKKWSTLCLGLTCLLVQAGSAQQSPVRLSWKELTAGPSGAVSRTDWLRQLKQWRTDERRQVSYRANGYGLPAFRWARQTYIHTLVMAHDRYLYDPVSRKYTADRYLQDLKKRYGGIDAVLIWPTYPNMGIDNRNQFDLLADMPGGLAGVKQLVADLRKRGVRVFFPVMIWDKGTRSIPLSMRAALVQEMKLIGADGLFGDTMFGVDEAFKKVCDSLGYPLVFQPELNMSDLKMVEWNQLGWGSFIDYGPAPGINMYKWFEPQHQVTVSNRWAVDKTNDLQYAFFNGIGYVAWENIWGIWNQVPERYARAIRKIATIYRQFPETWNSNGWEPYIPVMQTGVFAAAFPGRDGTVYTLVNRDTVHKNGAQLRLPYEDGMEYFDIWNGVQLTPRRSANQVELSFSLERRGFGAVLALRPRREMRRLSPFLKTMKALSVKPLQELPDTWKPLPQQITDIRPTPPARGVPTDMVLIPAANGYRFESNGVMIEGTEQPSAVGVQHPWEQHPSRSQQHTMDIASFYIDKYPVTNRQFKAFMDATRYHPADDHNFLKDWKNGNYPDGWDNKPVTWVALEDARAYAAWAGKRLPHEWEWQYAAQGNDNRLYPWGNEWNAACIPPIDSSRNMRPPTDVSAFPKGAGPFGLMDVTGNVWQWTDEYSDAHTRSAILKGGCYYQPITSHWYFPRAYELNRYGKYLLLSPGMDRSAAIGFRCVRDK